MLLVIPFFGSAQKVKKDKIDIEYLRLPLNPLPEGVVQYQVKADLEYLALVEEQNKRYEEEVQAAEQEYQTAYAQYEQDAEDWKNKSVGEKLLDKTVMEESKPKPPYKRTVSRPVTQKLFDDNIIANYITLEGYEKGTDNGVTVYAVLKGFEATEAVQQSRQYETKNKNGTVTKNTKYYFELEYKHPIAIRVEHPVNGLLWEELVDGTDQFTKYKSKEFDAANKYSIDGSIKTLQNEIVVNNLKKANDMVNSKSGFTKIKRRTPMYYVKAKKFEYPKFEQAMMDAKTAYAFFTDESKDAENTALLKSCIENWKSVLTEKDLDDKKARINEDVAIAAYFNIIEAQIHIDDYQGAQMSLLELERIDLGGGDKREYEDMKAFYQEEKDRYEANNN